MANHVGICILVITCAFVASQQTTTPAAIHSTFVEDDLVPGKPLNLAVLEVNSDEIRLSWIQPRRGNRNIDGYYIYYTLYNYTDVRTFKKSPLGPYIIYTLEDLMSNTEYTIFVKAFNSRYESEAAEVTVTTGNDYTFVNASASRNESKDSELFRNTTEDRGPSAPRHLNVVCQAKNTIFIQWERPDYFFNTIDYYYINIFYLDRNTTYQNYAIPTSQDYLKVSFAIANVTSNAYRVQVRGASYSQSSGQALLEGQATEPKEVYVQFDCDKLQQYNMRHATVCSELIY